MLSYFRILGYGHISIFLFTLTFLTSCGLFNKQKSDDVNPKTIYTSYSLTYQQETNQTTAFAAFNFDNTFGTRIQLTSGSKIEFNNTPLDYSGFQYRKEFSGYVSSGTFAYTDTEGKVFKNSIYITTTIQPGSISNIKRNTDFSYSFVGSSLQSKESIDIVIKDKNNKSIFISANSAPSNYISFPKSKLDSLALGTISLTLKRNYTPDIIEKTEAGGFIMSTYEPSKTNLVLE